MKTLLAIETNVYGEDHLRDEMLEKKLGDDINSCGIILPETVLPLRKNRNSKVVFEYTITFTRYQMERLHVHGRERTGYSSDTFLGTRESIVTISHLFKQYLGSSLADTLSRLSSEKNGWYIWLKQQQK